jgi:hypothetical protein
LSAPSSHPLFAWRWHHFRPPAEEANYLAILEVLGDHEGEDIDEARDDVNEEVHALRLGVGLGIRAGEDYADIFRDRIEIWRFTGAIVEPGLVDDEIQLTPLGRALVNKAADFDEAMFRQAVRLRFPHVRVGRASQLEFVLDGLEEAIELGPGVNVARAWVVACGHLRERGHEATVSGDEAARFLSGATAIEDVSERAEALADHASGLPTVYPDPGEGPRRQGREIAFWLRSSGVLFSPGQSALAHDPQDRDFEFSEATTTELMRWSDWWGSWN